MNLVVLLGIEENNRIKPAGIMEFVPSAASQYQDLIVISLDPKIKCKVKMATPTRDELQEALEPKHVQEILGIGRSQTYELFNKPPFHVVKSEGYTKFQKLLF
ncbi:hypothetical protein [Peribacillus simplex]|uniref:hypothetical protein n=1 Tax=Peribacillus simplex TaxID=1478 RepID=UPI0024C12E81|nr:hypothetical protein [Peribacillus simplex]WHY57265.1 hypothetical protein QNH43_02840 [Peribacillus simplex]